MKRITNSKICIVGGTFDSQGGRPSHFIDELAKFFKCSLVWNGGEVNQLYTFRPVDIDILIWMPDIDNSEDKILPRLKVMNPKMILVSSKRIIENYYPRWELINRTINTRSNLNIIVNKNCGVYEFSLIDPLGNIYCEDVTFAKLRTRLKSRLTQLLKVHRVGSKQMKLNISSHSKGVSDEFLEIVKNYGENFSDLVQANNPKRYMGNASTRCEWGFPSARINGSTSAWVSRRNVNKESVTADEFVKTKLAIDNVLYFGKAKPSVDSAIQLKLYQEFPNINYMIHGHCYIEHVPFTKNKLPCGDLGEVAEIKAALKNHVNGNMGTQYRINLRGHGCVIMGKFLGDLKGAELYARPLFEH